MKKFYSSIAICAMATLLGGMITFAQQQSSTLPNQPTSAATANGRHYRVSNIIDHNVENLQGESLGEIEDLVFDGQGEILYAVLSYGGFLGLGDKYFAVPWPALSTKVGDKDVYVLDINEERLKNAPGFDKNHWPDTANNRWGSEIYSYYGQSAAWQEREARNRHSMENNSSQSTTQNTTATRTERDNMGEYIVIPTLIVSKVDNPQSSQQSSNQSAQQSAQQKATTTAQVEDLKGQLRLRTTTGDTMEFAVSQQLLDSLEEGDSVEVVLRKNNGSSSSQSGSSQQQSR